MKIKKIFLFTLLLVFLTTFVLSEGLNFDIKQFKSLDYKITIKTQTFNYGILIDKKGKNYEITTYTKYSVSEDEKITIEDLTTSIYAGIIVQFFNPAYEEFLNFIDLQNPITKELYGMKIEYEGQEKVGKYSGEKFTLVINGEPEVTWVINKDLKMVIKIVLHQSNTIMELVDFKRR